MADSNHYVRCDNCCYELSIEDMRIDTQIVSKNCKGEKVVAVCYYFVCPICYHRYNCFYKDKEVNKLFEEDKQEEAQKRMEMLYEVFEEE